MVQEQLFPTFEVKNNAYSVGNGYSIEFASDKLLTIYRYGVPYKKTEIKAAIDKRRLAVELVSECQVTKS